MVQEDHGFERLVVNRWAVAVWTTGGHVIRRSEHSEERSMRTLRNNEKKSGGTP